MRKAKETKNIRISRISVSKGHSGTGSIAETGKLPQMQPHIIVKLENDETEIFAEMSIDNAKKLEGLLAINLK